MKYGDELVITSVTDDKRELLVRRDLLCEGLLCIEPRRCVEGRTIVGDPVLLNRESARVLFAALGAYLHTFPND